jgi:hypothetical protein
MDKKLAKMTMISFKKLRKQSVYLNKKLWKTPIGSDLFNNYQKRYKQVTEKMEEMRPLRDKAVAFYLTSNS